MTVSMREPSTAGLQFPSNQAANRARLFAAHQSTLDQYWDESGRFRWAAKPEARSGGYRILLDHCLAYLAGDAACVERAGKIIVENFEQTPCHFAPGVSLDILLTYRDRLSPDAASLLTRLLELNVPYMSTEDLKIHGYNDNHVHKAIYTLICGGELLGTPRMVEVGLHKLRQAIEVFERAGFPCEYNSPNYAPVSLQPLAGLVEHARSEEAREMALRLEHFYWQDVALHFDPRVGLPTGPMTRCGDSDATGRLGGSLGLLAHLFPERFDFDLVHEIYGLGLKSDLLSPSNKDGLPIYQACTVWMAMPEYHFPSDLESILFEKPAGAVVRGTAESGASAISWKSDAERPDGAPRTHHLGSRRSLLTTYYGAEYTLGTAQYSWLDGCQTHSFYATAAVGGHRCPQDAVVYYTRLFFDDENPYGDNPKMTGCFKDQGDIRTVQYGGTALVFYNPHPCQKAVKKISAALLRPIEYSRPQRLYVGDTDVSNLNAKFDTFQRIAIDEGAVYVGIIPLVQDGARHSARKANLQLSTYSSHLAIVMTGHEYWGPTDLSYEQLIETNMGFAFEIHPASDFSSFGAFRSWLADSVVEDDYYAKMRTTTYRTDRVTLSASYSPWSTSFRHVSVNGSALPEPTFQVDGMRDPGYSLVRIGGGDYTAARTSRKVF